MRITLERPFVPPTPTEAPKAAPSDEGADFDAVLGEGLEKMDEVTRAADRDAEGMIAGEVDLHDAMISMEKANLVLRMGTTVRNKLLDAYRQLSQVGG